MMRRAFDYVRKILLDDHRKVAPSLDAAARNDLEMRAELDQLAKLAATVAASNGPASAEELLGDSEPLNLS